MSLVVVYDVTAANYGSAPKGVQLALYGTGTSKVAATAAMLKDNPNAVIIDQTPSATAYDDTADVDDYESGAVTLAELAPRAKARIAAYKSAKRVGQRMPLVYASKSNLTPVANALVKGGVISGVGLWVADWNLTQAEATAEVTAASGPFPVIGVQFKNAGPYDISIFSATWLAARSAIAKPAPPKATAPPGQWLNPGQWSWKGTPIITGTGLDNQEHAFAFNPDANNWSRIFK